MEKILLFKIGMKLYKAFIAPCFNSCAERCHSKRVKHNEKTVGIVYLDNSSSYEMLLKIKDAGNKHCQSRDLL